MIPITKPLLSSTEINQLKRTVMSGWVTQGPKVKEFEDKFSRYVKSKNAVAVSNCTTALHLSLLAIGVKPGEVVITVSHSFIATANSIRYCLCEPVFIDIEKSSFNMDPNKLRSFLKNECTKKEGKLYYKNLQRFNKPSSPLSLLKKVTGKVAAIIFVHQMGFPANLKAVLDISKEYNIPLIEDAACAVGSEISINNDRRFERIGKPHGDIACFSFHPRKLITTGDGGMITTNSKNIANKLYLLRQHFMSIPDAKRHKSTKVIFEEYNDVGYNYRMTDIQATIGIEQLKKIKKIIKKRQLLANYYNKYLKNIPWLKTYNPGSNVKANWQSYPLILNFKYKINQMDFMQYLLDHKIASRRGIMNAHQETPYNNFGWVLPNSQHHRDNVVLIPLYHQLTNKDIRHIAKIISDYKF